MPNESVEQVEGESTWQPRQVYAMAAVCLVVGLAIGYLFRGSQSPAALPPAANAQSSVAPGGMGGQMPSLDQMKHMADKKAAPLLEKLKSDPTNVDLLKQVGNIYQSTHQFKDAAGYYDEALKVDPKNVPIRTQLASSLYYNGDVDGAISQLQTALQYDPKDANSLFNLGYDQVAGQAGRQRCARGLAGVVEIKSATEGRAKSHSAETHRRRTNAGQGLRRR